MKRLALLASLAVVVVVSFGLGGCARVATEAADVDSPVSLRPIEGSELKEVTFSAEAVEDLRIASEAVQAAPPSGQAAVPLAAVFYDSKGTAWVYTMKAPGVYIRTPLAIDRMDGPLAYLNSGPPVGTLVVTVGATEIYGAETGIGAK